MVRKLLTSPGFQELHFLYACSFSTPAHLPCDPCVFLGSSESCQGESVYHALLSAQSTRKHRVHVRSVIILTWRKSQSACSLCVYALSAIEERIILTMRSDPYWKLPLTYCDRKFFIKCYVWGKFSLVCPGPYRRREFVMVLYIASVKLCQRSHPEFYKEKKWVCCRYFELYCHLRRKKTVDNSDGALRPLFSSCTLCRCLCGTIAQAQLSQPLHMPLLLLWSTFLNCGRP